MPPPNGYLNNAQRHQRENLYPSANNWSAAFAENSRKPNHDYTFEVDHKGLDINGFIRHTDKHKGKHHKFRVYVDENQNGRFDKNDLLIGKTGLKQKFADKGVGNLLDENEIGQLEVKFKKSALMRSEKSCEGALDSHLTGVSSFFFADSDGNDITQVIPFGESCGPS